VAGEPVIMSATCAHGDATVPRRMSSKIYQNFLFSMYLPSNSSAEDNTMQFDFVTLKFFSNFKIQFMTNLRSCICYTRMYFSAIYWHKNVVKFVPVSLFFHHPPGQ
jgi:hypothetical protein